MIEMQDDTERTAPPQDRRGRGAPEPDPNREQRTGGEGRKIGKSTQQEDRK
ncbi:MAG: hypothetical protein ABFC89_13230 [Methanospirillum sp.]